jgi:hypothetical protein
LPCYQTDPKKLVLGGPAEVPWKWWALPG